MNWRLQLKSINHGATTCVCFISGAKCISVVVSKSSHTIKLNNLFLLCTRIIVDCNALFLLLFRHPQTNVKMFNKRLLRNGSIIIWTKRVMRRLRTFSKIYVMDTNCWRFSRVSPTINTWVASLDVPFVFGLTFCVFLETGARSHAGSSHKQHQQSVERAPGLWNSNGEHFQRWHQQRQPEAYPRPYLAYRAQFWRAAARNVSGYQWHREVVKIMGLPVHRAPWAESQWFYSVLERRTCIPLYSSWNHSNQIRPGSSKKAPSNRPS